MVHQETTENQEPLVLWGRQVLEDFLACLDYLVSKGIEDFLA